MAEMTPAQKRAAERKKKLEEQRKKQAEEKARKEAEKQIEQKAAAAKDAEPERSWASDLGGLISKAPGGISKGVDTVTDAMFAKDSWGRTWDAIKDGPGGKEIRGRDLANMAVDATWAVPGVGLAGGAARMAARGAIKGGLARGLQLGKSARSGELSAAATRAEARSAASGGRHAQGFAGVAEDAAKAAPGVAGKRAAGAGSRRHAGQSRGSRMLDSIALRAERGGTRIGLGQSKRGVLRSAAVAGGLNAGTDIYDAVVNAGKKPSTVGTPGPDGVVDMSGLGGNLGPGAAGYYFLDATGDATPMPDAIAKALAAQYVNMGGSPDGSQVIYMGR